MPISKQTNSISLEERAVPVHIRAAISNDARDRRSRSTYISTSVTEPSSQSSAARVATMHHDPRLNCTPRLGKGPKVTTKRGRRATITSVLFRVQPACEPVCTFAGRARCVARRSASDAEVQRLFDVGQQPSVTLNLERRECRASEWLMSVARQFQSLSKSRETAPIGGD